MRPREFAHRFEPGKMPCTLCSPLFEPMAHEFPNLQTMPALSGQDMKQTQHLTRGHLGHVYTVVPHPFAPAIFFPLPFLISLPVSEPTPHSPQWQIWKISRLWLGGPSDPLQWAKWLTRGWGRSREDEMEEPTHPADKSPSTRIRRNLRVRCVLLQAGHLTGY